VELEVDEEVLAAFADFSFFLVDLSGLSPLLDSPAPLAVLADLESVA
jgi:hypothetical protein